MQKGAVATPHLPFGATVSHKSTDSPAPAGGLVLGRYKQNGSPDTVGGYTGGIGNLAHYSYAALPRRPWRRRTQRPCVDRHQLRRQRQRAQHRRQRHPPVDLRRGSNQQFQIHDDGTIRIQGKCLNAENAGTANGTLIQLWTCNGTPAQRFLPRADGSMHNPTSVRCLDLPQGNKTNGTRPQLWDCNKTDAQRWTIPTLNTAILLMPPY